MISYSDERRYGGCHVIRWLLLGALLDCIGY